MMHSARMPITRQGLQVAAFTDKTFYYSLATVFRNSGRYCDSYGNVPGFALGRCSHGCAGFAWAFRAGFTLCARRNRGCTQRALAKRNAILPVHVIVLMVLMITAGAGGALFKHWWLVRFEFHGLRLLCARPVCGRRVSSVCCRLMRRRGNCTVSGFLCCLSFSYSSEKAAWRCGVCV